MSKKKTFSQEYKEKFSHERIREGLITIVSQDKELEDMGWMITDFDVKYRTIVEMFEEETDITLLCYEQEEHYQFSGLGYFDDIKHAREVLFSYCQKTIKDKIENDTDYAKNDLDDEQIEAAEFFKAI